jgi:hypothetical protein
LLVDIAIDTVTRGYRIAARPGAVMRRARSLLDEDVDALEEAWEKAGGSDRVVKVLEELSGPKLPVLANEWLLELLKSPNVDVPDKALRSAPPRKLVSGKPPRLLGLA